VQFELASTLEPFERGLHGALYDCRKRLNLLPLGSVPETGKVYLRPPTPITREAYGAGSLYTWGNGELGCLGHGEDDSHVGPKCVDALRGRQVCNSCSSDAFLVLRACTSLHAVAELLSKLRLHQSGLTDPTAP
jgi:hypothetical protein